MSLQILKLQLPPPLPPQCKLILKYPIKSTQIMAIETKAGTTRALTNTRIPPIGTAIKLVIFKPDVSID
jgi:hypothetical protein